MRQRKQSALDATASKRPAVPDALPSVVVPALTEIKELAKRQEDAGTAFVHERAEALRLAEISSADEISTPLSVPMEPKELFNSIPELTRSASVVETPREVRMAPPLPPPAQYERPMEEALAGTLRLCVLCLQSGWMLRWSLYARLVSLLTRRGCSGGRACRCAACARLRARVAVCCRMTPPQPPSPQSSAPPQPRARMTGCMACSSQSPLDGDDDADEDTAMQAPV